MTSSGRGVRLLNLSRESRDDFATSAGEGCNVAHTTRIMYMENKSAGLTGSARIGRVTTSKRGKTLYYAGKAFQSLKGASSKANYFDVETGDEYWISGCKKDGTDRLYSEADPVYIDDDVRDEYWKTIRGEPERRSQRIANR
jgi:hypothetical protein